MTYILPETHGCCAECWLRIEVGGPTLSCEFCFLGLKAHGLSMASTFVPLPLLSVLTPFSLMLLKPYSAPFLNLGFFPLVFLAFIKALPSFYRHLSASVCLGKTRIVLAEPYTQVPDPHHSVRASAINVCKLWTH